MEEWMPFKSILTLIGAEQGDGDVVLAAQLCADAGAHLTVLVLGLAVTPVFPEFGSPVTAVWITDMEEDRRKIETRVEALKELLSSKEIRGEVVSDYLDSGIGDEVVGQHGRYSDLMVLGPELASTPELRSKAIEGALFSSGKPVLLLPTSSTPTIRPRRIMVGWDSGLEAARAVREALEMLQAADQVIVAIVDPEPGAFSHGEEPGADLAAYLARHGAKVTVDRLPREGRSTADVLRRHAVDTAADLVVLGAYGHSRLREWIFGGVTRSMIEEPPVPVFMAR
jgi:nucleotide-binding universal stress UspA family protein